MNIIITMAGLGSRFTNAGYTVPKYMIEAKGKTLFDWSLISLDSFKNDSKFWFVTRKENESKEFIKERCQFLDIKNFEIIEIDYMTSGQAETALIAIEECNQDEEVMVYNIDTYINPEFLLKSDIKGDGFIPCFKAPGEHWSFAKCDEQGNVIEVKEKEKISDNCSLGVYYFKNAKLYMDLYKEFYENDDNKKEKYIAPMYNLMIAKNLKVYISDIPYDEVSVLGTPEELEVFLKK